ncbi:MAG: histidine kinase [Saprospiraceae bacterium]|nr:histidine kinase [Saprospiraceae bacterium]
MLGGFRGGLTFGGFAIAIKLVKYWYFKKQELQQLQLEKTRIELKSLKDQLHPHFLFNTLNNLYAMTLPVEGKSSEVVMRLSDLLQYMLYECKADFVPLKKELQFIKHYIELEKLRFGENLDLRFNIRGEIQNYRIAPLLLLPLVENAFKHGVSETIEQPWLSIDIDIQNDQLKCRVLNSKFPGNFSSNSGEGIGLKNLKQRLDLIYPDAHKIEIFDEEEMFIVQLNIQLKPELNSEGTPSISFKSISS